MKRLFGAFAVAAYALPMSLGVITYAAHDLYHLHERLAGTAPHALVDGDGHHAFVHEHGDGMHSHDAAVDALLSATQHEESTSQKHAAASMEMTGHLPAHRDVWIVTESLVVPTLAPPSSGPHHFPPAPPPPPPRA